MTKPTLFLDIDGVINLRPPCGVDVDHVFIDPEVNSIFTIFQEVFIPKGTKERILTLNDAFQIVWASWWGQSSDNMRALICPEIAPWRHVTFIRSPHKVEPILSFIEENNLKEDGWAWIDDDFWFEKSHQSFKSIEDDESGLLVHVNPDFGMTNDHVKKLIDWAKARP